MPFVTPHISGPQGVIVKKLAPYAKAVIGAAVAGLGAAGVALTDGGISPSEWVAIATATLVALGGVYAVPNAPLEDGEA